MSRLKVQVRSVQELYGPFYVCWTAASAKRRATLSRDLTLTVNSTTLLQRRERQTAIIKQQEYRRLRRRNMSRLPPSRGSKGGNADPSTSTPFSSTSSSSSKRPRRDEDGNGGSNSRSRSGTDADDGGGATSAAAQPQGAFQQSASFHASEQPGMRGAAAAAGANAMAAASGTGRGPAANLLPSVSLRGLTLEQILSLSSTSGNFLNDSAAMGQGIRGHLLEALSASSVSATGQVDDGNRSDNVSSSRSSDQALFVVAEDPRSRLTAPPFDTFRGQRSQGQMQHQLLQLQQLQQQHQQQPLSTMFGGRDRNNTTSSMLTPVSTTSTSAVAQRQESTAVTKAAIVSHFEGDQQSGASISRTSPNPLLASILSQQMTRESLANISSTLAAVLRNPALLQDSSLHGNRGGATIGASAGSAGTSATTGGSGSSGFLGPAAFAGPSTPGRSERSPSSNNNTAPSSDLLTALLSQRTSDDVTSNNNILTALASNPSLLHQLSAQIHHPHRQYQHPQQQIQPPGMPFAALSSMGMSWPTSAFGQHDLSNNSSGDLLNQQVQQLLSQASVAAPQQEPSNVAPDHVAVENAIQVIVSSLRHDDQVINRLMQAMPPNIVALLAYGASQQGRGEGRTSSILPSFAISAAATGETITSAETTDAAGTNTVRRRRRQRESPMESATLLTEHTAAAAAAESALRMGPISLETIALGALQKNFDADAIPADVFENRDEQGRARSLPTLLAMPSDRQELSYHQMLLRYQIEVFRATEGDMSSHQRGRNRTIQLGQVGLRCRHCRNVSGARRRRCSVYFPRTVEGFYQAAQNMSTSHFQTGECVHMGPTLQRQFAALMVARGTSSGGAGRAYWVEQAQQLGLVNTGEGGIRFYLDAPEGGLNITEETTERGEDGARSTGQRQRNIGRCAREDEGKNDDGRVNEAGGTDANTPKIFGDTEEDQDNTLT